MEDFSVEYVLTKGKHSGKALYEIPREYVLTLALGHHPDKDKGLCKWVMDNLEEVLGSQKQFIAEPERFVKVEAGPVPVKEDCVKKKYISKAAAVTHMEWMWANCNSDYLPVRAYECDKCTAWHLTSQEQ